MLNATTRPHDDDLRAATLADVATALDALDPDDLGALLATGEEILRSAARPDRLAALLDGTRRDRALLAKCERFNLFRKIVLYEHPKPAMRLRLHLFGDQIREAHHHRASFAALVLRGSYLHLLFGGEHAVDPRSGAHGLQVLMAQEQRPGTAYALHHAMMHATLARPETVSLMLQAPAVRTSFRIYDLDTGQRRDRVGSHEMSGQQEPGESTLTDADVEDVIGTLRRWELA
jgi:hypothetical protein